MDDLSAMLSQILGSEEGMAQLRNVASQLGLGDVQKQNPAPAAQPSVQEQSGNQGADFSALASMLSGLMGGGGNQNSAPAQQPAQNSGGADLSGLASMLSGLMGNGANQSSSPAPASNQGAGTPDLSGLMSSLSGMFSGGANSAGTSSQVPSLPNIDLKTILSLQKAYQAFTTRDKNTDLLLALRPHFAQERQKKVDDAIRILGLIKMLPLLKESGILGSLGGMLGGDGS